MIWKYEDLSIWDMKDFGDLSAFNFFIFIENFEKYYYNSVSLPVLGNQTYFYGLRLSFVK